MSNKDLCAFHNTNEPITDETFKVCGECLHAWQTEVDFLDDCNAAASLMNEGDRQWGKLWLNDPFRQFIHSEQTVAESGICPLCTHNF